uniref:Uncharacterized protein n=1 Tax=Cucumis melo TaxID=3656 RepID=A0A9I9CDD2_CUCME
YRRKRELSKPWLPFSSDPSHGSDSSNPTRNHFQPSRASRTKPSEPNQAERAEPS